LAQNNRLQNWARLKKSESGGETKGGTGRTECPNGRRKPNTSNTRKKGEKKNTKPKIKTGEQKVVLERRY